jgi:hypothetical protein
MTMCVPLSEIKKRRKACACVCSEHSKTSLKSVYVGLLCIRLKPKDDQPMYSL